MVPPLAVGTAASSVIHGGEHLGLDPEAYERWRQTSLGTITEQREIELIFDLAGPLEGRHLLDVGCGDGVYLVEAAKRGASVTGVDASEEMLHAARRRASGLGVEADLIQVDAGHLPFEDASFDVVISITILCLVPDVQNAVGEMARVLKPGGKLIVGDLGRWSTWAATRRLRGWLGSPTWRHVSFRTGRQLARLIEQTGLVIEEIRGAVYYPPVAWLARFSGPLDRLPERLTTWGAAFIAVSARKRLASQP